MDRHTPPSPAPTKAEPLPTGFYELIQHNASASYPCGIIHAESIHAHSQPASRYGTPDDSPYGPLPEPYGTPATSPPTPSRGSDVASGRSNVRGEAGAKVLGPRSTRVEKSTPKRKKERARPPKNMPVLDKPMSELTKGSSIPIADIEAYVNRPVEVRRQEVETGKNPGRVKRPMNAFMLYRKAYQQRAKEWASQHNHQVVSRVCGLSWPLEPEHVRQQFKLWADTERDNHQKAHPNYKFTPAKPHKPPPKLDAEYDEQSDGSDLEDYDWAGVAGQGIRSATHTPGADSDYIPTRSAYAAAHPHPNQFAGMHPLSMLHHTRAAGLGFDPGKPLPGTYDGLQAQYYETHMRNQHHQQRHQQPGVGDDVLMHRTPSPSLAFQQPAAAGLHPYYDLDQYQQKIEPQLARAQAQSQSQPHQHQQQHYAHHPFEHRIDPSLLSQEGSMFDAGSFNDLLSMFGGSLGAATQQTWQATQLASATEADGQFSNAFMGLAEPLSLEQQTQFLGGEWQVEPLPDAAHLDTSWVDQKD
ncbi:uncharacterized protein P884DRAFT_240539 [Thermothelomyces heterothallicus CBS 202.75]|uniref:uncharacterized protein n=1 Tax=Thermothelomyces heterothallicus CBS 202.75 TaxID=1149848 RepID=UPI0037428C60